MRGKGEGSVYRRADGRWVAQVDAGRDPDTGRRRYLRRVRATRKAAGEALAALRREVGAPAARHGITVTDWCAVWLDDCAARVRAGTMAARTAVGYESEVRNHIVGQVGHVRLDQLSVGHVQRLLTAIQAAGGSAGLASSVRRTLSAALAAAIRDGLLEVNVARAATAPPRSRRNPSAFSDAEMQAIADGCRSHRLGNAFVFAALTGLRSSELAGLRWDHVDLDAGTYAVAEGLHRVTRAGADFLGIDPGLVPSRPKTAGSGQGTPMSPAAMDVLHRQRKQQLEERLAADQWIDSGRVFTTVEGRPVEPSYLLKQFRELLSEVGVPAQSPNGGRGLHELRRTFASRLRRAGVAIEEVQRLGRWSSPAMLLSLYRAIDERDLRDAAGAGDDGVNW